MRLSFKIATLRGFKLLVEILQQVGCVLQHTNASNCDLANDEAFPQALFGARKIICQLADLYHNHSCKTERDCCSNASPRRAPPWGAAGSTLQSAYQRGQNKTEEDA